MDGLEPEAVVVQELVDGFVPGFVCAVGGDKCCIAAARLLLVPQDLLSVLFDHDLDALVQWVLDAVDDFAEHLEAGHGLAALPAIRAVPDGVG